MEIGAATGMQIGPVAVDGTVSCVVDEPTWRALLGLADAVLFHPDLLEVLVALPDLILEGDLTDAMTDLVLNGAGPGG